MPRLLSGSTKRRGGSNEFIDLQGAMPQLPASSSTTTGFTLVTDSVLRTTYRSSLGNLEMNQGEMWSNLEDGIIKLSGTGTGFVYITSSTEAISTTTGALVVKGGVGIGGSLWTDNDIHVNRLTIGQGFEGYNNISIKGEAVGSPDDGDYPDGQENIAIGFSAMQNIAYADKSIAIGRYALSTGSGFVKTIAIGDSALRNLGTVPPETVRPISDIILSAPITITGITNDNPVIVTAPGHGLATGSRITIKEVVGLSTSSGAISFSLVNDKSFYINEIDASTFELYTHPVFSTSTSVDGTLTNWSTYSSDGVVVIPTVITAFHHGFETGDEIVVDNVQGTEELNNNVFWINSVDSHNFQLYDDPILASGTDGSYFSPYISDGTVHIKFMSDNNVAIGNNAGLKLYNGEQNFFLGDNIAPNLTTGSYNFFLGHDVATYMTNGSGNISIMGDNLVDGLNNQVNIGAVLYYNGDGWLDLQADTTIGLGTDSTSTDSGALAVNGGMGITGDLWVGGTIHSTFTVNTTTNIENGVAGDILIQTAPGITGFVNIGSSGTFLLSDGSTPYWGEIVIPSATSSTNALTADSVFVNTATGSTTYYIGLSDLIGDYANLNGDTSLSYDTTDGTLSIPQVSITSTAASTSTNTNQSLLVAGGVGIAGSIYAKDGNPDEGQLLYTPRVTVSATAPVGPRIGDFWIDPTYGVELQYIKDGTSTFWIQFTGL